MWGLSCEDVTKSLMLVRTSGNTLLVGTGQYPAFVGTSLFAGTSADTLLMGTGKYTAFVGNSLFAGISANTRFMERRQYKHFQTDLIYDDVLVVAILVNLLAKPLG